MSVQETDRKPERGQNQHEKTSKRKESNELKSKESPKKVICFGCGQMGHLVKNKKCPKNNKEKTKVTVQIYTARDDEDEESEPYKGSQYSSEGEEMGFEDKS